MIPAADTSGTHFIPSAWTVLTPASNISPPGLHAFICLEKPVSGFSEVKVCSICASLTTWKCKCHWSWWIHVPTSWGNSGMGHRELWNYANCACLNFLGETHSFHQIVKKLFPKKGRPLAERKQKETIECEQWLFPVEMILVFKMELWAHFIFSFLFSICNKEYAWRS